MQEKKKSSLLICILSIIFILIFAIIVLILGIVGLVLASSHQKETQMDYKTEKILNIIGIVISVINMIAGVMLTLS